MIKKSLFWIVALVLAWPLWIFVAEPAYENMMQGPRLRAHYAQAEECLYPWKNVKILQQVARPGTTAKDNHWYTAIYYEQILPENQLYRKIALYEGKSPNLETCEAKVDFKYGVANNYDPQNPPVAMTIYEGDFVLQTTDDPKGGVPLDKLPLVFGPRAPLVSHAKKRH